MPLLGLRGSGAATAFGFGKAGTAWEPAGAYDSLATVTVGTAVASIDFAGIPTGYQHLQIRGLARSSNASNWADVRMKLNADVSSNYSFHYVGGDGTSPFAAAGATQAYMFCAEIPANNSAANIYGGSVIDILDYSSIVKNKTLRSINGTDKNGTGYLHFHSGAWYNSSTAITSLQLTLDAGSFMTNTTFSLYGVK